MEGIVRNGLTNDGLSGVTLDFYTLSDDYLDSVETDYQGQYSIVLEPGDVKATVSKTGFITTNLLATVIIGQTVTADTVLFAEDLGGYGTIQGRVTNASSGQGIYNARVALRSGVGVAAGSILYYGFTDINGYFDLSGVDPGTYTAEVSADSFITGYTTMVAVGGVTLSNQNIALEPADVERVTQATGNNLLTFSEYSVNTTITDQYPGIQFGGRLDISGNSLGLRDDSPFITTDTSAPTSPVLSGVPRFEGPLAAIFDDPQVEFQFSAGYFDTLGDTNISVYDTDGLLLQSVSNDDNGIEVFAFRSSTGSALIKGFEFIVGPLEAAGAAIDNLVYTIPQAGKRNWDIKKNNNSALIAEDAETGDGGSSSPGNSPLSGWNNDHINLGYTSESSSENAFGSATISIEPDQITALPGDSGTFAVNINSGAVAVGAYNFTFNWTPGVMTIDSVQAGTSSEFGMPVGGGNIDNTAGQLIINDFQADSLTSPTGSFTIATVNFTAGTIGKTNLILTVNELSDTDGSAITPTIENGNFAITLGSTPTFSPSQTPYSTVTGTPTSTPDISPSNTPIDRIAMVSIDPQNLTRSSGGMGTFAININSGAVPVGAYNFTLNWTPGVMTINSVQAGTSSEFGSPVGGGNIDNAAGQLIINDFQADSLTSPTGSFTVATVNFTAGISGSTNLILAVNELSDTDGNAITPTTENGTLTITSESTPTLTSIPYQTPLPIDPERSDINEDGYVDYKDQLLLMKNWHRGQISIPEPSNTAIFTPTETGFITPTYTPTKMAPTSTKTPFPTYTSTPSPTIGFTGGEWSIGPNMTQSRESVGGAVVNGKLYVIGGEDSSENILNIVEVFDPKQQSWSQGYALSCGGRESICYALVAYKNSIYIFGGKNEYDNVVNTIVKYIPLTGSCSVVANMSIARRHLGAVLLGDYIYLFGGEDSNENILNTIEVFNPNSNSVQLLNPMPEARSEFGIVEVQGDVYIIGGVPSSGGSTSSVMIYSPDKSSWQTGVPMPVSNRSMGVQKVGDYIYAICGLYADGVYGFDIVNEVWRECADKPILVFDLACAVLEGKIYCAAGGLTSSYETTVVLEIFDPTAGIRLY